MVTKSETSKLLAILAAAYPRFEVDELKIQVWHEMLSDLDYQIAQMAAKKCISEQKFAPSIAEVRQAAVDIMTPDRKTAGEAWGEVQRAVGYYGYISEAEALESLSPLVATATRQIGWQQICAATEMGVVRGQFMKIYEQVERRENERLLLPEGVRQRVDRLADKLKHKELEAGKHDD